MKTPTNYIWVRRIHRNWIFQLEAIGSFYGFSLIPLSILAVVGLVVSAYFVKPPVLVVFVFIGTAWALYFAVDTLVGIFTYNLIRCPKCGFNPTRRKADGRSVNPDIMCRRLEKLEECPACGFAGDQ